MVLRINGCCFLNHGLTDPCNGDAECFLGGRNLVSERYVHEHRLLEGKASFSLT